MLPLASILAIAADPHAPDEHGPVCGHVSLLLPVQRGVGASLEERGAPLPNCAVVDYGGGLDGTRETPFQEGRLQWHGSLVLQRLA